MATRFIEGWLQRRLLRTFIIALNDLPLWIHMMLQDGSLLVTHKVLKMTPVTETVPSRPVENNITKSDYEWLQILSHTFKGWLQDPQKSGFKILQSLLRMIYNGLWTRNSTTTNNHKLAQTLFALSCVPIEMLRLEACINSLLRHTSISGLLFSSANQH